MYSKKCIATSVLRLFYITDLQNEEVLISLTDLAAVISWSPTWHVSTGFVTRLWRHNVIINGCILMYFKSELKGQVHILKRLQ